MSPVEYINAYFLLFLRCYAMIFVFRPARAYLRASGMITLSTVISLCFAPSAVLHAAGGEFNFDNSIMLVVGAFRELLIGALISLPLALALESLIICGRITDVSRGAQFGEQVSPILGARSSHLESIAVLFTLVVSFTLGGYRFLLSGLYQSLFSPGLSLGFRSEGFSFLSIVDVIGIIALSQQAITSGLLLAAPVVVMLLLLDLAASLLTRAMGRINVLFELMPLKLLLGVVLLSWLVIERPNGMPRIFHQALMYQARVLNGVSEVGGQRE